MRSPDESPTTDDRSPTTRRHRRRRARQCLHALVGVLPLALGACARPDREPARAPDVEFVPSEWEAVDTMLALARVTRDDVIYDLGSGDGRILIAAAKRFGARGVGIDIDPMRIAESRRNADTAGVRRLVEFREGDLFDADFSRATVVTLFLLPELNLRLAPRLIAELRPGTRVISHEFDMGDWRADSTALAGYSRIHLWTIPANIAGRWSVVMRLDSLERRYGAALEQRFQRVTGVLTPIGAEWSNIATIADRPDARRPGREIPIEPASVRADSVRLAFFDATRLALVGRAVGDTMSGWIGRDDGSVAGSWRAIRIPPS